MHPSPFTQTSGGSGSSQVVNFTRSQPAPTATHTGEEADSWIEVASHPSDSAYTSSSDEHIITAGLQVSAGRRRRRSTFRDAQKTPIPQTGITQESEHGSSESDEEEEEGEDMGSMINEMPMSSDGYSSPDDEDEEDSDDEASPSEDLPAPRTVFSASSQQRPFRTRSQTTPTSRSHGPGGFNMFAPNHATDHDEALRASLSTLLSCAAAARGLTKSPPQSQAPTQSLTSSQQQQQQSGRVAVEGIRVVREGNLPSEASGSVNGRSRRSSMVSATADPTAPSQSPSPATKCSEKREKEPRNKKSKSKRRTKSPTSLPETTDNTPPGISYSTLALSAGAILILSAITFSAGYALGREVGKSQGGLLGRITSGGGGSSGRGGKAVVRGLSRAGSRGIAMGGGGVGSVMA